MTASLYTNDKTSQGFCTSKAPLGEPVPEVAGNDEGTAIFLDKDTPVDAIHNIARRLEVAGLSVTRKAGFFLRDERRINAIELYVTGGNSFVSALEVLQQTGGRNRATVAWAKKQFAAEIEPGAAKPEKVHEGEAVQATR